MRKRHIDKFHFRDAWLNALLYDSDTECLEDEWTRQEDWNVELEEWWLNGFDPDYVPSWEREECVC